MKAILDRTNPRGIHIGKETGIAFGAVVLSHDFINNRHVDTWIGERTHVGASAIILPGVRVGDNCVVSAGSVVMKDVPSGSLVAGNPARVFEKGLVTREWGIIVERNAPKTD